MTTQELIINIEKALDEIRPFLESDGGNISLVSIEDDKLVRTAGDFSDSLASISPKLLEPAKYSAGEEKGTKLTPESIVSGVEQGEESSLKPPVSGEQDAPTIIAIEDDTISSQYQDVSDTELEIPPPPPGISDGIEAD